MLNQNCLTIYDIGQFFPIIAAKNLLIKKRRKIQQFAESHKA